MLKRVKINGYKSFNNLEITLKPLSVLFGPNGVGKSNFLDALQLLSRMATFKTLKDAFEPPNRGKPLESFNFGNKGLKGFRFEQVLSFSIEVDVELSNAVIEKVEKEISEMKRTSLKNDKYDSNDKNKLYHIKEKNLRYGIEIQINPKTGFLQVSNEYLAALNSQGNPKKGRRPFLERQKDKLHLRMEKQSHPAYYDRFLDHSIISRPLYPPHYPHMVAMRRELESWLFFYFEPRERMRAPNPVKEVRHIGLMGEELAAFLNTLKAVDSRKFNNIERALRMVVPSITGIKTVVSFLGEVELSLLEGEIPIPARLLSEGTLRLLGLLSIGGAKESPSLIGFEEPENGVHPIRIRLIAELLRNFAFVDNIQMIVTTHSPLLLDHFPQDTLYICRKQDRQTCIEYFESTGPLFRKKEIEYGLSDEEELKVSDRVLRGDFDV